MMFYENRLPTDDSHEISCLIRYYYKSGKNFKFSSAAIYRWRFKGLLLLTFCLLLLSLWESVIVLCFVVRYFMSILVLQSS